MKIVSMLLVLTLIGLNQAQASGCGSYQDIRDVLKQEIIKTYYSQDKYAVESFDTTKAVVSIKGTDKKISLDWVSSSHADTFAHPIEFQERDIKFNEGGECQAAYYQCVTGQVVLIHYDKKNMVSTTYAFPRIVPAVREPSLAYYVTDSPLLQIFGNNIKLDVPPMGDRHINGKQCGYGGW